MAAPCLQETVWYDKYKYDDAEKQFQEHLVNPGGAKANPASTSSLVGEIARARQHIKHSLQSGDDHVSVKKHVSSDSDSRLKQLEKDNKEMQKLIKDLRSLVAKLEARITSLEGKSQGGPKTPHIPPESQNHVNAKPEKDADDDDIDLFGSDEEVDEEANKLREKRLQEYGEKKSKKAQLIAKSSVILDIKPWDDETDMQEMEKQVRNIQMDGLLWGASKLVPLAYGIKKLQIVSVVEDEKVSIEELQETIEGIEDLVQSVDIAAFNKI